MAEDTRTQDIEEFWEKPLPKKHTWKGWKTFYYEDLLKRVDSLPSKFRKDISVLPTVPPPRISDDEEAENSQGTGSKRKQKATKGSTPQAPPAKKSKAGPKVKPGRVSKKHCEILNLEEADFKIADGFFDSVNLTLSLAPGYVAPGPMSLFKTILLMCSHVPEDYTPLSLRYQLVNYLIEFRDTFMYKYIDELHAASLNYQQFCKRVLDEEQFPLGLVECRLLRLMLHVPIVLRSPGWNKDTDKPLLKTVYTADKDKRNKNQLNIMYNCVNLQEPHFCPLLPRAVVGLQQTCTQQVELITEVSDSFKDVLKYIPESPLKDVILGSIPLLSTVAESVSCADFTGGTAVGAPLLSQSRSGIPVPPRKSVVSTPVKRPPPPSEEEKRYTKVDCGKEDQRCSCGFLGKNTKQYLSHFSSCKGQKCLTCSKEFTSESNCWKHFRVVHLNKKIWKCLECQYSNDEEGTVKYHMQKKHQLTTDIACPKCKQIFAQQKNLVEHQKICGNKMKLYKCTVAGCKAEFRQKASLKLHFEEKHEEEDIPHPLPYPCKDCDKRYKYKGGLDKHIESCHGAGAKPQAEASGSGSGSDEESSHSEFEGF